MEFRLCTNPQTENQACFNQNVLRIADGPGAGGTKLPAASTGLMRSRLQLPSGVRCDHCIIQWNYRYVFRKKLFRQKKHFEIQNYYSDLIIIIFLPGPEMAGEIAETAPLLRDVDHRKRSVDAQMSEFVKKSI